MPSKIEWTDETWNPIAGCTKCSPGCDNCYAERMGNRLAGMAVKKAAGGPLPDDRHSRYVYSIGPDRKWNNYVGCYEEDLDIPLHWRKPRRIFVCSMSDLFHLKVPYSFMHEVYRRIVYCRRHTFLILTKRPQELLRFSQAIGTGGYHSTTPIKWPCNAHLGVSISTPDEMWKAEVLSRIPAAVRWISFEPLLAGVGKIPLEGISWVVVGGESGPGARPMHPDWVRNVRDQCVGVPFFFKQWGAWLPGSHAQNFSDEQLSHYKTTLLEHNGNGVAMFRVGKKKAGRLLDGKEWNQLPERR